MNERSADYIPDPNEEKPGCGSMIAKGLIAVAILAGLLLGTCALLLAAN